MPRTRGFQEFVWADQAHVAGVSVGMEAITGGGITGMGGCNPNRPHGTPFSSVVRMTDGLNTREFGSADATPTLTVNHRAWNAPCLEGGEFAATRSGHMEFSLNHAHTWAESATLGGRVLSFPADAMGPGLPVGAVRSGCTADLDDGATFSGSLVISDGFNRITVGDSMSTPRLDVTVEAWAARCGDSEPTRSAHGRATLNHDHTWLVENPSLGVHPQTGAVNRIPMPNLVNVGSGRAAGTSDTDCTGNLGDGMTHTMTATVSDGRNGPRAFTATVATPRLEMIINAWNEMCNGAAVTRSGWVEVARVWENTWIIGPTHMHGHPVSTLGVHPINGTPNALQMPDRASLHGSQIPVGGRACTNLLGMAGSTPPTSASLMDSTSARLPPK